MDHARLALLSLLVALLLVLASAAARADVHRVRIPRTVRVGGDETRGSLPASVTRWRPQVTYALRLWHRRYHLPFRASDVWTALRIMCRESRGYRWARNIYSGAAGLFQWLPPWWRHRGPGGRDYPIYTAKWNIGMMAQYHASHEAVGRNPWAPWRMR
jgi:hypothetical protein